MKLEPFICKAQRQCTCSCHGFAGMGALLLVQTGTAAPQTARTLLVQPAADHAPHCSPLSHLGTPSPRFLQPCWPWQPATHSQLCMPQFLSSQDHMRIGVEAHASVLPTTMHTIIDVQMLTQIYVKHVRCISACQCVYMYVVLVHS